MGTVRRSCHRQRYGFTLIELLVVIGIIALLMAILMPSLSAARAHAKTVVCGSNLNHVGKAVANYLYMSKGDYPSSYLYPDDEKGNWTMKTQEADHPHGYVHWSYFLYDSGSVGGKAFQCPSMDHGGAPRTNPGLVAGNWEAEQVDQNGDDRPNELQDKQAERMAYAANAAIIPRNKFNTTLSGGARVNQFVAENRISHPGSTILATEYINNWIALGITQGDGILCKSHRPINPFFHVGSGFNEYAAPEKAPGFIYGLPDDQETYGILPTTDLRNKVNILDHTSGISQLNAVGRRHPGGDKRYEELGGTANFLFVDGHVEQTTVLQTVQKREWGDKYYSISGENEVMNMSRVELAR